MYASHIVTLIACSDTPFDAEQSSSMRCKTGDSEGMTTGMYPKIIISDCFVHVHCKTVLLVNINGTLLLSSFLQVHLSLEQQQHRPPRDVLVKAPILVCVAVTQ